MNPELLQKALSLILEGKVSVLSNAEVHTLLNYLISIEDTEEELTFSSITMLSWLKSLNALTQEKYKSA